MKKLLLACGALLLIIFLYFMGEQVYSYKQNGGYNLRFLLSNQSDTENVDIEIFIDKKSVYDTCMVIHPGYLYTAVLNEKIGRHEIDIVINGEPLYGKEFGVFLNRIFVIDYQPNDKLLVETSWRKMMIQ